MANPKTLTRSKESTELDVPWNVIVHDDPVNLVRYVIFVLMKIFGYNERKSTVMTMQVHRQGRSIVWSGEREKAEFYVQQLQAHQLKSTMEKSQ